MKNSLLLPHGYKVFGWVIFLLFTSIHTASWILNLEIPAINLPLMAFVNKEIDTNISDEIMMSFVIIGLVFIAFAKEKQEDEFIAFLRLKSWQWSVLIAYGLLFFGIWLIYGMHFLSFMVYNMYTVLLVFIVVFNWHLYQLKRAIDKHEK